MRRYHRSSLARESGDDAQPTVRPERCLVGRPTRVDALIERSVVDQQRRLDPRAVLRIRLCTVKWHRCGKETAYGELCRTIQEIPAADRAVNISVEKVEYTGCEIARFLSLHRLLPSSNNDDMVRFWPRPGSPVAYAVVMTTGAWSLVPTSARTTQLVARAAIVLEARM